MKRIAIWRMWAAFAAVALLFALAPRAAAQNDGVIRGQVLNLEGKPWTDLKVESTDEQGGKNETKTDQKGNYYLRSLRHGVHVLSVYLPNQAQPYQVKVAVPGGEDVVFDFNFKDIVSKQNPQYAEAVKKQEEEKQKLESVKTHFAAGNAALDQMRQVKNDLQKAPADQRETLKQKLADLSNQAVGEFQAAQKGVSEKDQNQALFWFKLGEAYDLAGRNDDSVNAYRQALTLKPDVAGYYNNMGNVLAKAGRIDEAKAAYMKSAELDPANAATAWRNFGIVLFNIGQYKDAIEPLKKAAAIDPKNPQSWYVLASCMVGAMGYKKEGDTTVPEIIPGTIEAFEKAIELDPNGPYGAQAKQGLAQLQQMAPGIKTSIGAKKKKS